ncbi:MAG TPA: radical SAM protein [bacterium]|nr:radical SAM protein [bacterium]
MSNFVKKFFLRLYEGNKNIVLTALDKPLKPRWIWFEVTDLCNSHCTHCQIWAKKEHAKPLTLEEMRKIFSDPILKNVESVINSGGEAILRQDIVDILKLEHELFPKAVLDLSTNAIWPDRAIQVVKEALSEGIRLNVGISLDGVGEKHDQVRGVPGNFAKVDFLIKELKEIKKDYPKLLTITVGFTLSNLTLKEYYSVKEYCQQVGVDELAVQWYNQSSFYGNDQNDEVKFKEEMKKIVLDQPQSTTRERWLRLLDGKSIKFECFAGNSFFAMKCDGTISPCLTYWDKTIGNARDVSVSEIWRSAQAKNIRKLAKNCDGCLNSWGLNWSLSTNFYPRMSFFLRHPGEIIKKILGR